MADLCWLLLQSLSGECAPSVPDIPFTLSPPLQKLFLSAADQGMELGQTIATNVSFANIDKSPQFGQLGQSPVSLTLETAAETSAISSPLLPPAKPFNPHFSASPWPRGPRPHQRSGTESWMRSRPAEPAPTQVRPGTGSQLYRQRLRALQAGQLYTRLSPAAFADDWQQASHHPTYQDWLTLLAQEARAAAFGQGQNRLEVIVGDSMGQWLPPDMLPRDRLWLNQGISGDTTGGIVQRLSAFAAARPSKIHLLAGVNDLKNGVPAAEIVQNYRRILQQLQQQHPDAEIIMYSVFPTRWAAIPNPQVRSLNIQLAQVAQQTAVTYRNVHRQFQDPQGALRSELTTDGLHLNAQGYGVWRRALLASTI